MNYIKQLEKENGLKGEALRSINAEIDDFLAHLHSDKFSGVQSDGSRKDWISTADVINRLRDIRAKTLI